MTELEREYRRYLTSVARVPAGDARADGRAAHDALIAPVIRAARESLRLQHKSYKTEQTYLSWIDRFLRHSAPAAPVDLGAEHVRVFLSWLAVERRVSASTQSQAWNALLFLFRFVFDRQIDGLAQTIRARMRVHLDSVRVQYLEHRRLDRPGVPLPNALERRYPAAATDWLWYWVFPARKLSADPRTGTPGRYHVYPTSLQKHVAERNQRGVISPFDRLSM